MATITKQPHASNATVARLRLPRRAQPRTPKAASVSWTALALHAKALSQDAAKANPATSSNAPAPKNAPAASLSLFNNAQMMIATAPNPEANPPQSAGLLVRLLGAAAFAGG